jgi:hypothetical protein
MLMKRSALSSHVTLNRHSYRRAGAFLHHKRLAPGPLRHSELQIPPTVNSVHIDSTLLRFRTNDGLRSQVAGTQ